MEYFNYIFFEILKCDDFARKNILSFCKKFRVAKIPFPCMQDTFACARRLTSDLLSIKTRLSTVKFRVAAQKSSVKSGIIIVLLFLECL